jgi:hypothetical protein
MNFDYQDLKFWLEDKDVLPQAYWDALEDYEYKTSTPTRWTSPTTRSSRMLMVTL